MTKTKLVGLVVAAAATYGVWHWHHASPASPADAGDDAGAPSKLLLDRIWIDHMPTSETDTINAFVAIDEAAMGVFQQASVWQGKYEMFQFELNKNTLRVRYPQTSEREDITVNATECKQRDFDYCLEVKDSSRGVKRYVSRKGWEIDATSTAKSMTEQTEALEAQLAREASSP